MAAFCQITSKLSGKKFFRKFFDVFAEFWRIYHAHMVGKADREAADALHGAHVGLEEPGVGEPPGRVGEPPGRVGEPPARIGGQTASIGGPPGLLARLQKTDLRCRQRILFQQEVAGQLIQRQLHVEPPFSAHAEDVDFGATVLGLVGPRLAAQNLHLADSGHAEHLAAPVGQIISPNVYVIGSECERLDAPVPAAPGRRLEIMQYTAAPFLNGIGQLAHIQRV